MSLINKIVDLKHLLDRIQSANILLSAEYSLLERLKSQNSSSHRLLVIDDYLASGGTFSVLRHMITDIRDFNIPIMPNDLAVSEYTGIADVSWDMFAFFATEEIEYLNDQTDDDGYGAVAASHNQPKLVGGTIKGDQDRRYEVYPGFAYRRLYNPSDEDKKMAATGVTRSPGYPSVDVPPKSKASTKLREEMRRIAEEFIQESFRTLT
jgi:hypothetical protein